MQPRTAGHQPTALTGHCHQDCPHGVTRLCWQPTPSCLVLSGARCRAWPRWRSKGSPPLLCCLLQGLAALLVQGLSGCTPDEIVRIQPTFIELLGLQQSLTPSRNNGFLNMFKLMQKKALEVYLQQQQAAQVGVGGRTGMARVPHFCSWIHGSQWILLQQQQQVRLAAK